LGQPFPAADQLCGAELNRNNKNLCVSLRISFLDEEGKRRYVSLKTKDEETAKRIAEEIVPRELATARELIHKEVDRYIEFYRAQRSEIHSTDNSNVLYGWATQMVEEHECLCVQQITTQNLQAWFGQKCHTVKTVTAAAYLLEGV
jgi:uncharacterized protein involved in tolerance to divalent cations